MSGLETIGLSNLISNLKKAGNSNFSEDVIKDLAQIAKDAARDMCPLWTGTMKATIDVENVSANGFSLCAYTDYAIYNEFGSFTTPAGSIEKPIPARIYGVRPFLRPALLFAKRQAGTLMRGKLGKYMDVE